jgi:DNA-binding winged helix-turn-helix (wHTH) protein
MSVTSSRVHEFGPFGLDVEQRLLTRSGHALPLAPKTFDLLVLLAQRPGHAFSKQALISALWPDTIVEDANLSFQISTLRKALDDGEVQWIETIPKFGYRFSADVRTITPSFARVIEGARNLPLWVGGALLVALIAVLANDRMKSR